MPLSFFIAYSTVWTSYHILHFTCFYSLMTSDSSTHIIWYRIKTTHNCLHIPLLCTSKWLFVLFLSLPHSGSSQPVSLYIFPTALSISTHTFYFLARAVYLIFFKSFVWICTALLLLKSLSWGQMTFPLSVLSNLTHPLWWSLNLQPPLNSPDHK